MGALIDILIDFGYWGMLAAAFLAGSFFFRRDVMLYESSDCISG